VNLGIPRGSSRGAVEAQDAAPGAHAGEPGSLAVAMSGQAEGERATGFVADGDAIALLGAVGGGGSMGGSAYALHLAGAAGAGGEVPEPDLAGAGAVLQVVRRAVQGGLLSSARPVGRGGLGVALAEACAASGAAVRVPYGWAKERVLFGEEPGRVLVSLAAGRLPALEALAREGACPLVRLGAVGGDRLEVQAALSVGLDALLAARRTAAAGAGDAPDDTARA
jgi:phosphoribosylformylglycinamidine synthase